LHATSALWAVERDVLAEGGEVEIIEPAASRQHLAATARRLAQRHSTHA